MVRNSGANREETRRLLFVTATRARDELYVTGKYVAYGKKRSYNYNLYLQDAYDAVGKEFNIVDIQAEAEELAEKRKKERLEARNKMIEEMAAKKRAVGLI